MSQLGHDGVNSPPDDGAPRAGSGDRVLVTLRRKAGLEAGTETTRAPSLRPRAGRYKVAFVELTVFGGILPLASGYLEAYARTDPAVVEACEFEKYSTVVKAPRQTILSRLLDCDADVYAFSCYVWNGGLVRWLVDELRRARPEAILVLGGPQVMRKGDRYIPPSDERLFVCNGEGERTFRGVLQALLGRRDLSDVRGLSFRQGGQLVTTHEEERIADLSEIPSPFLEGLFAAGAYTWAVVETNRGCPYRCTYCYWGAATGSRVYKFEEDRLRRELEWISRSGCFYLFFADANWGMLKRDVELSKVLADCKKRFGAPLTVYFAGAKNTPDRVGEITRIFHAAGMVATQSIALQTMSTETLRQVERENIKPRTYTELQRALNEQGISSFLEMIWPLPGETLSTFRQGLGELCATGAESFLIYPLLLVNNVAMAEQREDLGLVTRRDPDENSEAEVVIQTRQVSRGDYEDGLRFSYAVTVLHSLRGLWLTAQHLAETRSLRHDELIAAFVDFWRKRPDDPFVAYCEASIATFDHYKFNNVGGVMHLVLHEERDAFDALLHDFARSQPWWSDVEARTFFELDIVGRPYLYLNTPIGAKPRPFGELQVTARTTGYLVEVPHAVQATLGRRLGLGSVPSANERSTTFEVHHRREQLPFMENKSLEEHYAYAQDMLHKMRSLLPRWTESESRPRRAPRDWLARSP